MEDATGAIERGARVAELRASFESALRASAEPPTAQVRRGDATRRWFPRARETRDATEGRDGRTRARRSERGGGQSARLTRETRSTRARRRSSYARFRG